MVWVVNGCAHPEDLNGVWYKICFCNELQHFSRFDMQGSVSLKRAEISRGMRRMNGRMANAAMGFCPDRQVAAMPHGGGISACLFEGPDWPPAVLQKPTAELSRAQARLWNDEAHRTGS